MSSSPVPGLLPQERTSGPGVSVSRAEQGGEGELELELLLQSRIISVVSRFTLTGGTNCRTCRVKCLIFNNYSEIENRFIYRLELRIETGYKTRQLQASLPVVKPHLGQVSDQE